MSGDEFFLYFERKISFYTWNVWKDFFAPLSSWKKKMSIINVIIRICRDNTRAGILVAIFDASRLGGVIVFSRIAWKIFGFVSRHSLCGKGKGKRCLERYKSGVRRRIWVRGSKWIWSATESRTIGVGWARWMLSDWIRRLFDKGMREKERKDLEAEKRRKNTNGMEIRTILS